MILQLRKSPVFKKAVLLLVLPLLLQIFFPTILLAIDGPSQPEFQSFEPIGTSEMVDLTSGDFKYNIPLLDVGGYPININYQSGITMDQQASVVGLGWTLNVGSANRTMRGMPDDFKGNEDAITKEFSMRPNRTWGGNVTVGATEIIGSPLSLSLGVKYGLFYNNYNGAGFERGLEPSIGIGDKQKGTLNLGLGLSMNSQQGIGIEPSVGFSLKAHNLGKKDWGAGLDAKVGFPYNSRAGLKSLSLNTTFQGMLSNGQKGAKRKIEGRTIPLNGGASIPVSVQTHIPQIQLPFRNYSIMLSAGVGPQFKWTNLKAWFRAYYNEQRLMYKQVSLPAYGYLYAEAGQDRFRSLQDFNRENDGAFTKNTPSLPVTNHTYDVINLTGQGMSGMIRPYRGGSGTVFDNQVQSMSFSDQRGIDFGGGDLVKGGGNMGFNFNLSTSGMWSSDHEAISEKFAFQPAANQRAEAFYFKQAGELVPIDQSFYAKFGGDHPVRTDITEDGAASGMLQKEEVNYGTNFNYGGSETPMNASDAARQTRQRRNQMVSALTAKEASNYGLHKSIKSYSYTDANDGSYSTTATPRTEIANDHHLSEMTIVQPGGSRYIYGIPVYNLKQREVSFNVAGKELEEGEFDTDLSANPVDCALGLVQYIPGVDNSNKNKRGIDRYFSATTLPPFSHTHLLTAVLSTDYVDSDGEEGPSPGDLGNYTLFNYERKYSKDRPYKWRVPYKQNHANYSESLKADTKDDKGNYLYGEKEQYYLHSVVTKTHIAEFYYGNDRKDGHGVLDENGGLDLDQSLPKLDSILLFSKCDREDNGNNAFAIKKVHFTYDYSLCPNTPNNQNYDANLTQNTGKLTLKRVHFSYGNSKKGELSPYQFSYGQRWNENGVQIGAPINPPYHLKASDRWGIYKEQPAAVSCAHDGATSTAEFPYAVQDRETANNNATAWHLTSIQLPSGGAIKADYEADDYAFVQDRKAMQMVKVAGLGNSPTSSSTGPYGELFSGDDEHVYLFLDLPEAVTSREELRAKYLQDEEGKMIPTIYFRFLVDVIGKQAGLFNTGEEYEYVNGYADLDQSGGLPYGYDNGRAWIRLKKVPIGDKPQGKKINPIAKTAWQFARLHLSKLVYPGSQPNGADESALRSLLGMATDVFTMAKGFNKTLRGWKFGQKAYLEKCMIRLYTPSGKKLGGGHRIKSIKLSDGWSGMGGDTDFYYGQEYQYHITPQGDMPLDMSAVAPEDLISSGVATYEPTLGNEENPFHQPISFTNEHRLAPDDQFYVDSPAGESLFPGPRVVYSHVKVQNLQHAKVKRTATGFIVHEYYTAKDFPVYTKQTGLERLPKKPSWLRQILKVNVKDYMTASQGFTIELNNMAGVPKAQWVYPEYPDGTPAEEITPISGVEYFYKTQAGHPKILSNSVTTISPTGTLGISTVGKEMDVVHDMRENKTNTTGMTIAVNLDLSLLPFPPVPVPIPSVWPSFVKEETRFRSSVITKVITRYGILEKTVAHDNGSRVSTENLAFDRETGEVLLTRTRNEFKDPVYAFNYPAAFAYDGMGMAYRNTGIAFSGVSFNAGMATIPSAASYFHPGDVLASTLNRPLWVVQVNPSSIKVVDKEGNAPSLANGPIKIIRSGRRNMQNVSIGTVSSLASPIVGSQLGNFKQVLNAGAVEFTDDWPSYCECGIEPDFPNPFISGARGNWRAKRSLVFLTDRLQANLNRNTNIRKDGTYSAFEPYWLPPPSGGTPWTWGANTAALGMTHDSWTFTSEVTLFSPYGFELENRDALNRYSSATYGYQNTLPTAVSSNARYSEIGFDNFEDYDCNDCQDDHFSFKQVTNQATDISRTQAHTGRRSLKVGPGQSFSITKILVPCDSMARNPDTRSRGLTLNKN